MADPTVAALLEWQGSRRRHVLEQVEALTEPERRAARLPSGWTPLGLVQHLALDVERVWLRRVMTGADVELPLGYAGWTVGPDVPADAVLEGYRTECALADAAVVDLPSDAAPAWWFDGGEPPYDTLRDVLLHVLVETATHAGHLDVVRELADGGQRLVLDEP
ncbi:DUF664 domain-containing protein [Nocardioides anomalus]|uniref:DUF664 domain-containing protein n=1 Tax=Nocardioides anomalus TaxID=2712223 RepID=A0A6G6WCJ2_9ACTN|nr:DUF664 domain-containing protein [Nocardioides anomalus]QIG42815.1 DUF664 domain-containing protein [Nocardioides anomalus]